MDYKVVVTSDAEEDFDRFIQYLLFEKKNEQAARNILDDFEDTLNCLKNVAGSLSLCENQRLRALGYHRMNFLRHRYFILYRIEENMADGSVKDISHKSRGRPPEMKQDFVFDREKKKAELPDGQGGECY